MISYIEVGDERSGEWNSLVEHPLQSFAWSKFREKRQKVTRLARVENGTMVRVWLIIWTKIPGIDKYFGYIPMGDVCDQKDLKELARVGKTNKAIGIRMEPNVTIGNKKIFEDLKLFKGKNLFKQKTYIWDLKLSEEELLAKMHQKGRYNIKVADKHGVTVEENNQGLDEYIRLLFEGTVKRQKVGMHDKEYQTAMFDTLSKLGVAKMFAASYKGEILSIVIVYLWKKKIYYAYGANSLAHKEVMAATKLIWEVTRWAKKAGYEYFDLWGTEEGKGFGRFKEQFGAELVTLVGSHDLAVNLFEYMLFRIIEEIRWKLRHR